MRGGGFAGETQKEGRGGGLVHFLLDKLQPPVHGQHGLAAVLLQKHGTDQFVNVRGGVERGEFLLFHVRTRIGFIGILCNWIKRTSANREGDGVRGRRTEWGVDFLHTEVLLLLGLEFLSGFDIGLKICIVEVKGGERELVNWFSGGREGESGGREKPGRRRNQIPV